MEKVLVTGGSGFIGRKVVEKLLLQNYEVTATSSAAENDLPPEVKVLYTGLSGIDWEEVEHQDIIVHLAANNDTRCTDAKAMTKANVHDSIKLFNHAKNAQKIVYASSAAVYGASPAPYVEGDRGTPTVPLNLYGKSKLELEQDASHLFEYTKVSVVGLRFCNVYGPGEGHKGNRMSMIGQIIRKIMNNEPIKLFKDGYQLRDWLYVEDAAESVMCAIKAKNAAGIYNIGTGKATAFLHVVREIELATSLQSKIQMINHPFPEEYQNHTECCIEKARLELNYDPCYTLTRGIREYVSSLL